MITTSEFREGFHDSYVVRTASRDYLGCCYLYPTGRRTPLTAEFLDCDVDVSWWVAADAHSRTHARGDDRYPRCITAVPWQLSLGRYR